MVVLSAKPGRQRQPTRERAQALQFAVALQACSGELLWKPDPHPVLLHRAEPGQRGHRQAIAYWKHLGDVQPGAGRRTARRSAAGMAWPRLTRPQAGCDATVHERTLAERQRALGNDHPDTLTSCGHLARAYAAAGRHNDALPMYERVMADREWVYKNDSSRLVLEHIKKRR